MKYNPTIKKIFTKHNIAIETDCVKQNRIIWPWVPSQLSLPILEDIGLS